MASSAVFRRGSWCGTPATPGTASTRRLTTFMEVFPAGTRARGGAASRSTTSIWGTHAGADGGCRCLDTAGRRHAGKDLSFVPLRPERVVEVRYDYMEGERFCHTAQFNRWRNRQPLKVLASGCIRQRVRSASIRALQQDRTLVEILTSSVKGSIPFRLEAVTGGIRRQGAGGGQHRRRGDRRHRHGRLRHLTSLHVKAAVAAARPAILGARRCGVG